MSVSMFNCLFILYLMHKSVRLLSIGSLIKGANLGWLIDLDVILNSGMVSISETHNFK